MIVSRWQLGFYPGSPMTKRLVEMYMQWLKTEKCCIPIYVTHFESHLLQPFSKWRCTPCSVGFLTSPLHSTANMSASPCIGTFSAYKATYDAYNGVAATVRPFIYNKLGYVWMAPPGQVPISYGGGANIIKVTHKRYYMSVSLNTPLNFHHSSM